MGAATYSDWISQNDLYLFGLDPAVEFQGHIKQTGHSWCSAAIEPLATSTRTIKTL